VKLDIMEAGLFCCRGDASGESPCIRSSRVEEDADQCPAMRDLDAAGTRLFGDLNYLVEILFGQVPLTDLCAGRRCAPRTVRVLGTARRGTRVP
jgi:hypothetical protein